MTGGAFRGPCRAIGQSGLPTHYSCPENVRDLHLRDAPLQAAQALEGAGLADVHNGVVAAVEVTGERDLFGSS